MGDRYKELANKTIIISIGRVSTQLITFLLLPLYTAVLTTEEYGTVDLISTLVQLIIPIISLMIDQGVFRYLLNCETLDEKKKTISGAFYVLLIGSIVVSILYAGINCFVVNPYSIWVLLILIATAFSNLFLQIARGLGNTTDYAIGSFVCSSAIILLNVICIAAIKMGAIGMLIAMFAGNLICSVFLCIKLRIFDYLDVFHLDKQIVKKELTYSIPLIPNQLSIWILNSSDRIIVTIVLGAASNGILAVSHKFPAIYMAFFNVFQLAWHEMGAIHFYDEDRDIFFSATIEKIVSIFSSFCIVIIGILPIVFDLFVNVSFRDAYFYIPIYLVAFLMNILVGTLGVVYVANKKTIEIAKSTFMAAMINIVMNICLVNYIGLYAAAISTLFGYMVTLIYRIIDTKKYLNIKYNYQQVIRITVLLVVSGLVYYTNNRIVSLVFLPVVLYSAYYNNKELIKTCLTDISKGYRYLNKRIVIPTIIGVAVALSALVGILVYRYITKPKSITTEFSSGIIDVYPSQRVLFDEFGANDFTCTGMTYDSNQSIIWIADCGETANGKKHSQNLIAINMECTKIVDEVSLDDELSSIVNLQGIAYDSKLDNIWLALGDHILAINKSGRKICEIDVKRYCKDGANGLAYDASDNSLWILCTRQRILHISVDGELLESFSFNFADQDQIVVYDDYLFVTVGAGYQDDNNYVAKVSKKDGTLVALYKVEGSNALEGICIIGDKVLIANDGLYHSDLVGHSYLEVYNITPFL